MTCRLCHAPVQDFMDLGSQPPANRLTSTPTTQERFPLVLQWCPACTCVQLRDTQSPEDLYGEYLYETPDTPSLTDHYDALLKFLKEHGHLRTHAKTVEAGSNNGLFLRRLMVHGHKVIGVEPAKRIAVKANLSGALTVADYFTPQVAAGIKNRQGPQDAVFLRHCLAHNPSPHTMLEAAALLISDRGRVVIENAYLMDTLAGCEWDQVYGEHMFYFSATAVARLLERHGLKLVDAMRSPVHGGSVAFVAARSGERSDMVRKLIAQESVMLNRETLDRFADVAERGRRDLFRLITSLKGTVATYGATAKGNTLLNSTGLTSDHVAYCVDSTPAKQGRYLPGSGIQVRPEGEEPDYFLLTAWNYRDEIVSKTRASGNMRTRFILPVPTPVVI